MKQPTWIAASALVLGLATYAGGVAAQTAAPPPAKKSVEAASTPDVKSFDKQREEALAQITRMQDEMEKIRQTQDPKERQRLIQEHWTTMQTAMRSLQGMWGPGMMGVAGTGMHGMMGGPGRMGWGGMRGYYSQLTPEQLKQRQYMMDQYVGMQQMMMNHMLQWQQWMTPPPAPSK